MRLPQATVILPKGLTCSARPIPARVWQLHLVKHPLGIHRQTDIEGSPRPWDLESWTTLGPPMISAEERRRALEMIGGIEVNGKRCGVPEVHGQAAEGTSWGCETCPDPVVARCEETLGTAIPVGARYAEIAESALRTMIDAVEQDRGKVFRALWRHARQPQPLATFAVMSVGEGGTRGDLLVARINRGDGVRVEFTRYRSDLAWRTTYRMPDRETSRYLRFLLDLAHPSGDRVSETCLVARPWWESYGN